MKPYTTRTGIKIGRAYVPLPQRIEGEALRTQAALLAKDTRPLHERVLNAVYAVALMVVILSICFVGKP